MNARARLLFVAVSLLLTLLAPVALAQAPAAPGGKAEGPAKALQKKAMEEDYLTTEFGKAQEKLEKALTQCGTDKCSPAFRAKLRRDLGVVQIGGGLDKEKGLGNFVEAIKLDPAVELDPDTKTKDLETAFAEAKKRAGGGGTAASSTSGPQGDFVHTPAAEQQVRTSIPVFAEYSGEAALVRVIVRYKGFGMTEWKSLELKKMTEKGWGGLVPCVDVQQGATQYYIQGFDAANDPVATSGDRNNPYRVVVKTEAVADPPHLPGAPAPTQCPDSGDCPPDFPGCKGGKVDKSDLGKEGGEVCDEDNECKSNKCDHGRCTAPSGGSKKPRFWVGVSGALDLTFVPSTDDVCKVHPENASDSNLVPTPLNTNNYYCTTTGGTDYPSRTNRAENDAILPSSAPGGSDKVTGGAALGNVRVMLTFDYAATGNLLFGARFGLVLNSYPGSEAETDGKRFAVPIHGELRLTYVFGDKPLYKAGFAPYAFVAAGLGMFETKVAVKVFEQPTTSSGITERDVDAWHLAGPGFASLGAGGRFAVTPRFALMLGVRGNAAFGNAFAPSVGPELGGQVGF